MKYIGIAFLIGILSGVMHNVIIFCHVLPYMRARGAELGGPFHFNKIIAEYFQTDDPDEKKMKLILRCLKIPFFIAFLIAVFGIYVVSRESLGE